MKDAYAKNTLFILLVNDKPTPTQLSPLWLMCNYLAIGEWSKWGFSRRFWNPKSIHSHRIFWDNFNVKNAMWLYTPIHHLSKKVGSKANCHEFRKKRIFDRVTWSKLFWVRWPYFFNFVFLNVFFGKKWQKNLKPTKLKWHSQKTSFWFFSLFHPS